MGGDRSERGLRETMSVERLAARPEPDEALLERLRRRDPQAFRWLLDRYGGPLFTYLARRLGDRAAAEDLLSDVLVRVLRHVERYQARGRFSAWLFTIAHRLCLDHLDRRALRAAPLPEEEGDAEPVSPEAGPEREAASAQLRERLERALGALPAEQREVFYLREYGGLSFAEIADAMDCPLSTALARMRYAVLKLRRDLEGFDA